MADLQRGIYHTLPGWARSIVASLRGFYLDWWRYGPETEKLVDEALERDTWNPERWKAWQEERLAYVLHRAATRVPYYREQWQARRRRGDFASWEYLENWPILEKETVREKPIAFVADDRDVRALFHLHTSGTTGKPLDIFQGQQTVRAWYALFEARCRKWYGVSRHDRWATLGGQLVTSVRQRRPPFWVWNNAAKQLYMSSYHLAPDLIPHYLEGIRRYRVKYLEGYTSSLYALAQEALRLGRDDWNMSVAITNAEPVFDYQREVINEAFGCPVRETYGMAEITAAASECEAGRLHLWPEAGWMEVIDGNQSIPKGSTGDLVCTGMLNPDMPLIRYRVGDRGGMSAMEFCTCGRGLPILTPLEGRLDDVLYTSDGRSVGRLDPVFKSHLPIREAQIIQESLDRVRVRYVPAGEFTAAAGQSIVEQLQGRMGPIEVILEQIREIPRTPNGKFRAVISRLPHRQDMTNART